MELKKSGSQVVDASYHILQTCSSSTKLGSVLYNTKSFIDMMASTTKPKEKGKRRTSSKTSRSVHVVHSSSWDELEKFLVKV